MVVNSLGRSLGLRLSISLRVFFFPLSQSLSWKYGPSPRLSKMTSLTNQHAHDACKTYLYIVLWGVLAYGFNLYWVTHTLALLITVTTIINETAL